MRKTLMDDPPKTARLAGLVYIDDKELGLRRLRRGRGFSYRDSAGHVIRQRKILARIRSLVIPPAWTDVWICGQENGHIQATGRDARGRKQYRYHPDWNAVRSEGKYQDLALFGKTLPCIRRRVNRDLRRRGLPRPRVLAAIVRLLETTLIRVGNEEYARTNGSYGLTTLRNRHVAVAGTTIQFEFRGKSGIAHEIALQDPRLAAIVKKCQELPGQKLFQYLDDEGTICHIGSSDVNDYLREISGQNFTAKHFRTWTGTALALEILRDCEECTSQTAAKKNIVTAVARVAECLGNTKAVCWKAYIHPAVFEAYLNQRRVPRPTGTHRDTALMEFLTRLSPSLTSGTSSPRAHHRHKPRVDAASRS